MDLDLQIGQSYVTRRGAGDPNLSKRLNGINKIVGSVDIDTYEYAQGYRFYSERGNFFTSDGKTELHSIEKSIG